MAVFGTAATGLFCAADVDADIVYSGPLNIEIIPETNTSYYASADFGSHEFDFNNDNVVDLRLRITHERSFAPDANWEVVGNNTAIANPSTFFYARKFSAGSLINPSSGVGYGGLGSYNNNTSGLCY